MTSNNPIPYFIDETADLLKKRDRYLWLINQRFRGKVASCQENGIKSPFLKTNRSLLWSVNSNKCRVHQVKFEINAKDEKVR